LYADRFDASVSDTVLTSERSITGKSQHQRRPILVKVAPASTLGGDSIVSLRGWVALVSLRLTLLVSVPLSALPHTRLPLFERGYPPRCLGTTG